MEVFSTTAAALGVAALFSNCVDCFEYIQLGRQFGQNFERCQIKLDVARTRLGRWGQAVGISHDPRFTNGVAGDEVTQQIQVVLEEIMLLFQAVQKFSKRYELKTTEADRTCFANKDMCPGIRNVHGRLEKIARERQQQTNLLKKARWALYDGKNLDKLVGEITDFVDALEKLVPPVEAVQRQLSVMELEGVDDESVLMALRDVAVDTDSILSKTADQKLATILAWNHVEQIVGDEEANVWVGNQWNSKWIGGLRERTENTVVSIAARGKSAIHVGNKYE
ncbi:Heterokaryon incompatibility protein S [Penicillium ucsense]|uniref:Heterokaryon incompatibility protein S n=1 Tax=Penicillium ucsense TaxID=2839758 RepID=A0A8J8WKV0_9EURO|nr:Heterokaryon incompatibility protein S [Penicillium ucsense]KAF7738851.1 Heterokaryon incompatibility protein S [Penicillium ucsense]